LVHFPAIIFILLIFFVYICYYLQLLHKQSFASNFFTIHWFSRRLCIQTSDFVNVDKIYCLEIFSHRKGFSIMCMFKIIYSKTCCLFSCRLMLNLSKISTPVLQSVFSFSSVTTRGVSVVNIWHRRSFFNSACGQKFCKVDFHNSVRKVPGVTASRLYSNYHSLASSTPGMKTLFKESKFQIVSVTLTPADSIQVCQLS